MGFISNKIEFPKILTMSDYNGRVRFNPVHIIPTTILNPKDIDRRILFIFLSPNPDFDNVTL